MGKKLDINDVIESPFYLELHLQLKILENFSLRPGYISGANNHHLLNESEKRTSRIFRLTSCMITMLQDIRLCYLFINKALDKVYLDRHEISEIDHIRYHYEVFIHKVHTVSEIMKLLCNETLDLGLSPKNCSWGNLITFKKFKTSKSKKVIEKNFNDFKHLIEDRHLNTHRGIFDDTEIDEFSASYFLYQFARRNNYKLEEGLQNFLSYKYIGFKIKEIKKRKVVELKKYEQQIFENAQSFFQTLELNGSVA